MNISGKAIFPFLLIAVVLTSCNSSMSSPVTNPTDVIKAVSSTVEARSVETQTAIPTATATFSSSTLPPSPSATPSLPISEQIVYYYFVKVPETIIPETSVVIAPDLYILAPTGSHIAHSQDTATDLRIALETMLNDERNLWISSDVELIDITFHDGHTNVILQGKYFGVGDVTLIAAGMQMLMTVFANVSVQTATITLNGDTIGNLGVSNSMNAKPADYIFTRTEVEAFINEHAYAAP